MIIPTGYLRNPSYYVADFSASYKWKSWKLEAGVTNFTNNSYFTRRATGYPGPGIIPSDTRTFYTTLEFILKDRRSHKIQNHLEIKH
jgi:outer membrane receptor protein involved in Fe transport